MIIKLIILALVGFIIYKIACKSIISKKTTLSKNNSNFGIYVLLWALIPSIIILIILTIGYNFVLKHYILSHYLDIQNPQLREFMYIKVVNTALAIKQGTNIQALDNSRYITDMALLYNSYQAIFNIAIFAFSLCIAIIVTFFAIKKFNPQTNFQKKLEKTIESMLFVFAAMAVLTTIGIIVSLVVEGMKFFAHVSIFKFLFGTKWYPESAATDPDNSFGIIPLLSGTFLIALISIITASVIGISTAIYTAEYMSKKLRKIVKPALEILAGIPSIVYGFFAALVFAPIVIEFFNIFDVHVVSENALSTGIVMGIMIVPFISSITDDVISSLSPSIKQGAMAMGSMPHEAIIKVLIPAAMPGIISGILLAISRAIGETMIVVMAASLAANLTFNPLEPVTTITAQIVMLVQGDQQFDSPKTLVAFALGLVLFLLTLVLNIIALKLVSIYKRKYV